MAKGTRIRTFKDHSALRLAKTRFALLLATRVHFWESCQLPRITNFRRRLVLPEGSLLEASS